MFKHTGTMCSSRYVYSRPLKCSTTNLGAPNRAQKLTEFGQNPRSGACTTLTMVLCWLRGLGVLREGLCTQYELIHRINVAPSSRNTSFRNRLACGFTLYFRLHALSQSHCLSGESAASSHTTTTSGKALRAPSVKTLRLSERLLSPNTCPVRTN